MYVYYLPPGLYFAVGYYSPLYLRIYYDGYGYNFYFGQYGYYEYSVNPYEEFPTTLIATIAGIVGCLSICVLSICLYRYC